MLPLPILLLTSTFASLARAKAVRVTIDDTEGDPLTGRQIEYSPAGADWREGHTCGICAARPDPERVHGGTWHDGTTRREEDAVFASVVFRGTAVWVQAILVGRQHRNEIAGTDLEFYFRINDTQVGTLIRQGEDIGGDTYAYNQTIYQNTQLPFGTHSLVIRAGMDGGDEERLLLLDSVIYEFEYDGLDEPDDTEGPGSPSDTNTLPSPNPSDKTRLYIATVIPSVVAVLALAAVVFLLIRNRDLKRRRHDQTVTCDPTIEPYMQQAPMPLLAASRPGANAYASTAGSSGSSTLPLNNGVASGSGGTPWSSWTEVPRAGSSSGNLQQTSNYTPSLPPTYISEPPGQGENVTRAASRYKARYIPTGSS